MEKSEPNSSPVFRMPSWRTKLPFFYGWVIVGSVALAQAIAYGIYYSYSVFFVALLEEFGWGRGPTAGVFSVFVLVIGLSGVVAGTLADRFGTTRVVPVGALFLSLGLVATSQLSELWQFYLSFGVLTAFGVAVAGWVPGITMVSRWFSVRRGVAMGIAGAGIGLGIVVMVPFCQYLISNFGWRFAYLVLAGLALFGIAPQAMLLQVARPEELGLRPDGVTDVDSAAALRKAATRGLVVVDEKWASFPWSVAAALRTRRFWLLGASITMIAATNQMLWVHQVAYLVDGGYDKMLAASLVGLAGFVSAPAKIMWGTLSDRLGREMTFTMGSGIMLLAILLLVLTRVVPSLWVVLAFAIAFAAGYAVSSPLGPAVAADLFTGRRFGSIFGVLAIGTGVGGGLGTWLGGFVFDVTGSYMVAFAVAAVTSCTCVACMWLAAPRKVRRVLRRTG